MGGPGVAILVAAGALAGCRSESASEHGSANEARTIRPPPARPEPGPGPPMESMQHRIRYSTRHARQTCDIAYDVQYTMSYVMTYDVVVTYDVVRWTYDVVR